MYSFSILPQLNVVVIEFATKKIQNDTLGDVLRKLEGGKKRAMYDGINLPLDQINLPPSDFRIDLHKIIKGKNIRYLVSHVKGDNKTFKHELLHALFFLNPEYKKLATDIFNSLGSKLKKGVISILDIHYDRSVHIDEFQAYLVTDDEIFRGAVSKSLQEERQILVNYVSTHI